MALLGDFLMGLARTVPGVVDGIEDRQEKERKRQELEAERKRQEMLAEQIYARNRADKIADTEEARAHDQRLRDEELNRKAIEQARLAAEREDAIAGAVGGQYGLSGDEVKRTAKTGLLQRTVEDEPGGHTVNDDARAEKVIKRFNTALGRIKAGDTTANVFKEFREQDEKEQKDKMTPEEILAAGRREKILKGGNPDLDAAREKLIEAQTYALINKTDNPPGAGRGAEAAQSRLEKVYTQRAEQADKDFARAEEGVAKASGSTKQAQKLAQDRLEAAQGRVNTARRELEHVLRTGTMPENEAGPTGSDAMGMARAEAVSSNQPVQYDIGGKRGTFAAGTGAEQAPAPAKSGPEIGAEVNGYVFRGGNPNDRANWEPKQAGRQAAAAAPSKATISQLDDGRYVMVKPNGSHRLLTPEQLAVLEKERRGEPTTPRERALIAGL